MTTSVRRKEKHDPMYRALGMFLRGKRLSHEITQLSVARRLDLKASQISAYETGMTRIPILLFCRWCQLLNLDPGTTLNQVYATMARRGSA